MSIERVVNEQIIEAPQTHLALPRQFVSKARILDTTPSVKNVTRLVLNNSSATAITNFVDGQDGQEIGVLGDGMSSVTNGAQIKTNTAANKLLLENRVYRFTKFNGVWIEDA